MRLKNIVGAFMNYRASCWTTSIHNACLAIWYPESVVS